MKLLNRLLFTLILITTNASFSQNFDDVQIKAEPLTERIYMLTGAGGNIGVSIGEDGIFVIDDQFAPLTSKILDVLKKMSDRPIQFLVNTHFHGDHTGGNENMAEAGATILAHENVRKRLSETPNRQGELAPKAALPIITFNDKLNLHINGEEAAIFHVSNAHTDGDAIIYFTESNVLHTGDTYFQGRYPYIDLKSGGSVDGYIKAAERSLLVIDDDTKIIPGHGKVSNKQEYKAFLDMMKDLKSTIEAEIAKGKSEEDVTSNVSLTKTYDDLGYSWRFITSERIRKTFYNSLKK